MAGLGLFKQKSARALAPRGFLPSACSMIGFVVLNLQKKVQAPRKGPGQFSPAPGATRKKTCFGPPREAFVMPPPIQKPSQKHQDLAFVG